VKKGSSWAKKSYEFLRLRMVSKYVLHYQEWTSNNMSAKRKLAFKEWKYKIENEIPYIDVDFSAFR